MTEPERKRRAAVAVIRDGDPFLVVRRGPNVEAPGKLCFPGGGIEQNETSEQAIIREVDEELGIRCRPIRPLWTSTTAWGVAVEWWVCEIDPPVVIKPNPAEVAEVRWASRSELMSDDTLLSSNREFLEWLGRFPDGLVS